MACIPMKVSALIESSQFWYYENWCKKFIEIDKCECKYCVLLKQLRDKTNRLYSGKFNLVFFLSNLDDFFKFIFFYSGRDWFSDVLDFSFP